MKWQYEQIIKRLLLLQENNVSQSGPCETDGERWERKHLLTIESYSHEIVPIEENQKDKDKLLILAEGAKPNKKKEEIAFKLKSTMKQGSFPYIAEFESCIDI